MLKFGALTAAIAVGVTMLSGLPYLYRCNDPPMNYLWFLLYPGGIVEWCYITGDSEPANRVVQWMRVIAISAAFNGCIGFMIGIVAGAVPLLFGMTKDE